MTLRIDVMPSGSKSPDFGSSQRGATQSGSFKGEPVRVHDNGINLTNASEELSLAMASKVEQKIHAERTIRPGERPRVVTIARITEYLDKARNSTPPQELQTLARRLLQDGRDPRQVAREHPSFRTPTEQYLLLQYALQLGPAAGATPEALERIEDALSDLEEWFGKVIDVNLATIDQAGKYGDSAQEVRNFQGSVQVVLGKPSLSQALQEVLQLAGTAGGKLEVALSSFMEALGACLAATRSSTDKALLQTLVTDLYHLKSLKTLMEDCRKLLKDLRQRKAAARPRRQGDEDDEEAGHARQR